MRTLVVVRHAKSDWSGDEPDISRPLAKRGLRQMPASAAWIAAHHPEVDLAVVSPARRAQQTWEIVAEALVSTSPGGDQPELVTDERVYAAWGRDLAGLVRALPEAASTVVLVGHNPGLEELVAELAGVGVELPTSAVVVLGFDGDWRAPAHLVSHGRPPG